MSVCKQERNDNNEKKKKIKERERERRKMRMENRWVLKVGWSLTLKKNKKIYIFIQKTTLK